MPLHAVAGEPQRVSGPQVARPGRSPLERSANSLPHHLTSFIGREQEIDEVRRLLVARRLLTVTGPGGIGKTRLCHEIAVRVLGESAASRQGLSSRREHRSDAAGRQQFRDGVWLVELEALAHATQVPEAIAAVLGVREQPDRTPSVGLVNALRARQLLLIMDGCEHLVEACAELAEILLRACPDLRILATSREALGIAGEATFRVPPLSLPAGPAHPERATASEAFRLFVDRATLALPTFELTIRDVAAVERICKRLDGIPLAIELAAARVAVLSPEQIETRLDDRFRLLTGGSRTAPRRTRSLQGLFDWSHDLLDGRERLLFRRLAVFAGGWTLEAAESVCAGDGLAPADVLDLLSGLVTKSLVMSSDRGDGFRYRQLETIREYATEKLRSAGEETTLRRLLCQWAVALAERAEPELEGARQVAWLGRLDEEHDNFVAALAWAVECGDAELGLRLATALTPFWEARSLIGEGRRWLAELLTGRDVAPTCDVDARLRARALIAAGRLAINAGDHAAAQAHLTRARDIAQALSDRPARADVAYGLGYLARVRGDYPAAREHLQDALAAFRELGDTARTADTLVSLGVAAYFQGDLSAARALYEDGLVAYQAVGNRRGMAKALNDLGEVALEEGELAAARRFEEESLTIAREVGEPERVAFALAALAGVAAAQGKAERALRLGAATTSIGEAIGEPFSAAWLLRFERWLEPAWQRLSAEAGATAWSDGRTLSMERAIEYALQAGSEPVHRVGADRVGRVDAAPLSPRELEVAQLVARGLTNRQIAQALVVTEGSAANHVHRVLTKLGLKTRTQVAAWAVERGLGPSPRHT